MKQPNGQTFLQSADLNKSFRFLARQPIVDINGRIFGHELLFRSGQCNAFAGDPEDATRDVIDQCLLLMPSAAQEATFINFTRASLLAGSVTLLPPTNTVLEILETVEPDPEVLQVCRKLKLKGYRFALDDFSPADSKLQFLELADFIKIDFLTSPQVVRDKIYALVSNSSVRLLAEKVETEADVQLARSEGCELFQGYFFSKPAIVTNRIIPQNHAVYLQLLAALSRTPAEIDEIEKLVVSDASLCYRLLRLVNSAMYALPSTVSTIRSALLMVGDDEFRKLVTVAFTGLATAAHSKVLMHMAIERAKFCEMMAPSLHESGSRLYLLGMLSVVDTILRIPMKQLVTLLPLDREMKAALLGEGSSLAVALDCVRCHESGDWQRLASIRQSLGISDNKASAIYLNALQWADMTTHAML